MKFTNKTKIIALASSMILSTGNVSEIAYAVGSHEAETDLMNIQSNYEPTLEAYQSGNGVKAEWAVDILPQDVLYETGFEAGDELPNLIYGSIDKAGGRTGGQSFTDETSYFGLRSLKVHDTYTNGQQSGSPINGVVSFSNTSRTRFTEQKYVDKGTDLSMSLRVKTVGGSGEISPRAQGTNADYGIPMDVTFMEDVKVGDHTVKVSDISEFKRELDRGGVFYLASSKGKYNQINVISYNEANSTITVNSPFTYNFKKGDNVIERRYITPLSFPSRTVNSSEWTTINMNTKVPSYDYYDIKTRGFSFVLFNTTRGTMYIDDLKMGYATQTELYRDGQLIYQGKLSDYDDTNARDNAEPNSVANYNVIEESGKQYINIVQPRDNGTQYSYQVKAISNDGSGAYWSDTKNVNVVTGIQGYSYVIDKNSATNPSGIVNNTSGEIEINESIYKDHYLHIQTVDNAGNKSAVSHIKLDKVNDIYPPTLEITPDTTEWVNDKVRLTINAQDDLTGIKEIFVTGEDQVKNGDFSNGVEHWRGGDGSDPINFDNGIVRLSDSTKNRDKLHQSLFEDGITDSVHYIEVQARGQGVLNARRGISGGSPSDTHSVNVQDADNFNTYQFIVEKHATSNKNLVIERVGRDGWLEIRNVKVYEKRGVENNSLLDITENGTYTFIARDGAANFTTRDIKVSNIDNVAPELTIKQDITEDTHKDVILTVEGTDALSGVKSITHLGEGILINGELKVVKNGKYTFVIEDNAGNTTTKTHDVTNIVRELKFEAPKMIDNITAKIQGDIKTEMSIGDIKLTDWRDNNNDWKLSLEATQLKSESHTLPKGTLSFKGVKSINKLDGNKFGEIEILQSNKIIDDGPIEVVNSTNERGVYELQFKDNALKLNLTPDTIKKGTYKSKVTWILESTPEIK